MTLDDIREQWEQGMKVLCHMKMAQGHTHLVVLEEEPDEDGTVHEDRYHMHRYFCFMNQADAATNGWVCSVDNQRSPIAGVFEWLNKMGKGEGI